MGKLLKQSAIAAFVAFCTWHVLNYIGFEPRPMDGIILYLIEYLGVRFLELEGKIDG